MPQKKSFGQKIFLNFMHGFKSAILAEWKNYQNVEIVIKMAPVHEIQKSFWQKYFVRFMTDMRTR